MRFGHARLGDAVTHILLVDPIGRAVGHDQQLGARLLQRLAHLLAPNVLADRNAEPDAAEVDRRRHRARCEHPLLVEHAIIREIVLVADLGDAAAVEQRHGVIDKRRIAPWQPHENGGAAVGRIPGKRLAGLARRVLQGGLQHQILDRVAGKKQLGEGDQIGAGFGGTGARLARFLQIAIEIAHDGIELRAERA